MGDSLSFQLGIEIVGEIWKETGHPPNFASPTLTQATLNPHSGTKPANIDVVKATSLSKRGAALLERLTFAAKSEHVDLLRRGSFRLTQQEFANRKEYVKATATLLAIKMLQSLRRKRIELSTITETDKLILNLHTTYNREMISKGSTIGTNANVEVIIGSRHGMSCDFAVEILLARFLKQKGFRVVETSLFPIPDKKTRYPLRPKLKT